MVLFNLASYAPLSFRRLIYIVSETNQLYSLLFLLLAFTVIIAGWRLLPTELGVYALAMLAVPILFASTTNPLMSTPRFVLPAFPLFIVLGATVLKHRRSLAWWLPVSIAFSLVLTALFVGWYFVA